MKEAVLLPQSPIELAVREAVEPLADSMDLELVHVRATGSEDGTVLCLYVDGKNQAVDMSSLEKLNRAVSDLLDVLDAEHNWFKGTWDLEVSSPGLDRPLVKKSHFEAVVGEKIHLRTLGVAGLPKSVKVKLLVVDDNGVQVHWESKAKEPQRVLWSQIQDANLIYDFNDAPKGKKKKF